MGTSGETIVRVVALHDDDYRRYAELEFVAHEQYPDETQEHPLSKKAAKALKDVQPGDRVEIVISYDIEGPGGYIYPIVQARRITGSLEARVEALEAALKAAGIEIPEPT